MPRSLLRKDDIVWFARDVAGGARRFFEHVAPYRQRWILERVQVVKWPRGAFRLPEWQAHRGYWKDGAPQNTLASLRAARAAGAVMSEFDVRLTKDRVVVLFHDANLECVGRPELLVRELTYRELRAAVADSLPLATLREVLLDPEVPELLNVELKSETVLNDPLERYVARVVTECGAVGRVLFSSFNPFSVWKISNLLPRAPRALLVSPEMEERSLREMWLAPFLKIHMLNLDKVMVTESSMRMWKRLGVPVAVWTAGDAAEIEHYLALGAASVITDVLPRTKPPPESAPEAPSRH